MVIRGPLEASRGRMLSYHGPFLPIEYRGRSGRTSSKSITPIVVGIKVRLQTIDKSICKRKKHVDVIKDGKMQLRWMADATPKPLDCGRVRWRWDEKAWRLGVGGSVMSCCFLPPLEELGSFGAESRSFLLVSRLYTMGVRQLHSCMP